MNVKLLFYQKKKKKGTFCKNVNAAEGNPGVVGAVGLAGEDLERLPGRNTSVTQPTVFTKGNVGTSMVFTFWSLKHFMFCFFFPSFLSALLWFEIKSGLCWFKIKKVENQTQELKIVFVD